MASCGSPDLKAYARALLQVADDLEKVVRTRISRRSKHSHQAPGGDVSSPREVSESNGGIEVVTQDDFRHGEIADAQGTG